MPAHSQQPEVDISNAVWYLGIDFGTTGISAVLLNHTTAQRYPIYWSNELRISREELQTVNPQLKVRSSGEVIFRLPTVTYSGQAASNLFVQLQVAPIVVGSLASSLAKKQPGIFLKNFKPYLNIGIPCYLPQQHGWEPQLQLPRQQLVSLYWVRRTLQALLAMLTPKSTLPDAVMKVGAVGLKPETLGQALGQLEGVILGYPAAWGDTYHFNLREAVLVAKLVKHPEQIFFLEDAIATLLAALPISPTPLATPAQTNLPSPQPISQWQGGTLVINAGATTTELALVNLRSDLKNLSHKDFSLGSLPYGGNAIDQDIFCQLLYPQMSEQQLQQLLLPSDVELPLPGQADPQKRDRLALILQSTAFGQALLKAATYLKQILQHKDEFTLELGADRWLVKRSDLATHVISPFIQHLNRKLNALMVETGLLEPGIYQVLSVGGTSIWGAVEKWIQQKLPNATIVQDTDSTTGCWVAAGLATLPLYPQVLNRLQHQYSDYFLLLELLRAFPKTADDSTSPVYTLEEILQQLERRGLNTVACYDRLVHLVEGHLPPGLVPAFEEDSLLSQASRETFPYSDIASEPLFSQVSEGLYRPNPHQQERLRQYLHLVLSATHQKFEEPLIVKLDTKDW